MAEEKDWRLTNQENYLMGVSLVHRHYAPAAGDDHDHCAFCWAKFMVDDYPDVLRDGWATTDLSHWICDRCFHDFRDRFRWQSIVDATLDGLDAFSVAVTENLFAAFPEWRHLARSEEAEDGTSYLVVEVNPPATANVEHGLVIDTANNEITVGFDCYHSHFGQWIEDEEHFGTLSALDFIKQILSEDVGIVSCWLDDKWRGSAQLKAGSTPAAPSGISPGSFNRIRVRSWKGALNADISA